MERNVRKFSLYASYVSFFLRLIIAIVYWKDSLDFENIMHGVQASKFNASAGSQSPTNVRRDNMYLRNTSPTGR